jgi:hypothetical protein
VETVKRTDANDNDKAKKYFQDPSEMIKRKDAAMRESIDENNSLIDRLKQQSIDNAEKNDLEVQRRTFQNDQVGRSSFGNLSM